MASKKISWKFGLSGSTISFIKKTDSIHYWLYKYQIKADINTYLQAKGIICNQRLYHNKNNWNFLKNILMRIKRTKILHLQHQHNVRAKMHAKINMFWIKLSFIRFQKLHFQGLWTLCRSLETVQQISSYYWPPRSSQFWSQKIWNGSQHQCKHAFLQLDRGQNKLTHNFQSNDSGRSEGTVHADAGIPERGFWWRLAWGCDWSADQMICSIQPKQFLWV